MRPYNGHPTLQNWVNLFRRGGLDQAQDRDLADRIDRLAADGDLVLTLQLHGYVGPKWDYVATELARYGIAVISGWMRRNLILARCRERGSGGLQDLGRPFDADEIEEMAGETVGKALYHFRRDVLMRHRWSPSGGASLRTFFIGQCLMRFANIYRRWWGNESRFRGLASTTSDSEFLEKQAERTPGGGHRSGRPDIRAEGSVHNQGSTGAEGDAADRPGPHAGGDRRGAGLHREGCGAAPGQTAPAVEEQESRMTDRRIREQVERSSFGTPQARAARRTVPNSSAARVVAIAEAQRRAEESGKKVGG